MSKSVLPALLASAVLIAGCRGLLGRREVSEPVYPEEFVSIMTPTPTAAAPPTETPRTAPTPAPPPAKLTEECEKVIEDDTLSDVLKHRELFSIALRLEFKGRKSEAIAALREALKYRPENRMTIMKLAELGEGMPSPAAPAPGAQEPRGAPGDATARAEAPPGLGLSRDYFDIVNNDRLSNCAKGFKLFVLAGTLEREGKARESLFAYRKAVSLCPDENGPNATINRMAKTKIDLLEEETGGRGRKTAAPAAE